MQFYPQNIHTRTYKKDITLNTTLIGHPKKICDVNSKIITRWVQIITWSRDEYIMEHWIQHGRPLFRRKVAYCVVFNAPFSIEFLFNFFSTLHKACYLTLSFVSFKRPSLDMWLIYHAVFFIRTKSRKRVLNFPTSENVLCLWSKNQKHMIQYVWFFLINHSDPSGRAVLSSNPHNLKLLCLLGI